MGPLSEIKAAVSSLWVFVQEKSYKSCPWLWQKKAQNPFFSLCNLNYSGGLGPEYYVRHCHTHNDARGMMMLTMMMWGRKDKGDNNERWGKWDTATQISRDKLFAKCSSLFSQQKRELLFHPISIDIERGCEKEKSLRRHHIAFSLPLQKTFCKSIQACHRWF